MTLKKKLLVATAAGALTVAAAVPAMALENVFNGMYKLKFFVSDYETGGSAFIVPTKKSATAANYFEQRARIFYTAKANDDLKLVTGFEIDSVFGDRGQGSFDNSTGAWAAGSAFRNSGGALESDAVNLETKWVYLDFNVPSTPLNVKTGIMPIKDSFKGVFIDADIAGILANAKFGALATTAGYFRAYEATNGNIVVPRGTDNQDIATLGASYAVSKDLTVGGQYFYYDDNRSNATATTANTNPRLQVHLFGLNAEAKVGPATVSGFAAYQGGYGQKVPTAAGTDQSKTVSAWAANVAGKVKAGPGTAKATFLYTSGDQDSNDGTIHDWQAIQTRVSGTFGSGTAANSFNESSMMLLNRATSMGGTGTDQSLVYSTNNAGHGVILGALGYDAAITPKFYANVNAGVGFTAENKTGENGSHYLGTEINAEVGYKLFDNLTASFQTAYVFLGAFYDKAAGGSDPVDPYTVRTVLSYAF